MTRRQVIPLDNIYYFGDLPDDYERYLIYMEEVHDGEKQVLYTPKTMEKRPHQ